MRDKLTKLVDQTVYVEGTHALLIPSDEGVRGPGVRALYSPVVGVLAEVLTDGIVLKHENGEFGIYPMTNIRSVQLFNAQTAAGKPSSLLT